MTDTHTPTLNDLRAMPDAAFNRAIAEAAGWRVEYTMLSGYGFAFYAWVLMSPDEDIMNGEESGDKTKDEAWACAPDYANDLNAVMVLPIAANCRRLVAEAESALQTPKALGLIAVTLGNGDVAYYEESHASPARALATAWFAWWLDSREVGA